MQPVSCYAVPVNALVNMASHACFKLVPAGANCGCGENQPALSVGKKGWEQPNPFDSFCLFAVLR
jgi:hypothetical protein